MLNNHNPKKEKEFFFMVTKVLTMVAYHGKQSLQHLVNLGQKKRTGALGTDANVMNTGPPHTIQKLPNSTRYRNK